MLVKYYKNKIKNKLKVFKLIFSIKKVLCLVYCAILKISTNINYNIILYKKF